MPILFSESPGATGINIDSESPKLFPSTGTGARKFAAPSLDGGSKDLGAQTMTNSDHFTGQSAALKETSAVVDQLAENSRKDLAIARAQLETAPGSPLGDSRGALPGFSAEDLLNSRRDASALLNLNTALDGKGIAYDLYNSPPEGVFSTKNSETTPKAYNPAVVQLDRVSVDMDRKKGTVDCFFASLSFSLPESQLSQANVKAIRVFRSAVVFPLYQRGSPSMLSVHGVDRLSAGVSRTRAKTNDSVISMVKQLDASGLMNAVSSLNYVDPETNRRVGSDLNDETNQPEKNSAEVGASVDTSRDSYLAKDSFTNIDPTVSSDLNVLRNIRNQSSLAGSPQIPRGITLNDMSNSGVATSLVVVGNNESEFKEIAFLSLDKLKSTQRGGSVEFEFVDQSISYGRAYRYYIVSVDRNMIESVRSKIVEVTVEAIRVPPRPSRIFSYSLGNAVSMNIIVDDQLVEKFEIFRRESDFVPGKIEQIESVNLGGVSGYTSSFQKNNRLDNNFVKIGESLNGSKGTGSTFYDRNVVPGRKYMYRVYSVDVFANKSESPYEVSTFVSAPGVKTNELRKPTVTAEVDALTGKARITFSCDDSRVVRLFLARRDLTVFQKTFTTPSQVSDVKFGNPSAGHGAIQFEGTILRGENRDVAWNGDFENDSKENVFVDRTVALDHVYQYSMYGVDRFGNSTSFDVSRPVMITRRPMIDSPVNVRAEVRQGPGFVMAGVNISWQDGNVSVSSEDRLGNRTSLDESSVRTLYQIERRKVGEERWTEFPMVESLSFFDPSMDSLGAQSPRFRPALVEENQSYVYRVKAYQTGSFQSNYGDYVQVFASLPVSTPSNFRLRAGDTKVKPFYVVLNWDRPVDSGVVDKWEIERSVVNNFAANKLNLRNPRDFQSLQFEKFRTVFLESSRFQASDIDQHKKSGLKMGEFKPEASVFSGEHFFQDSDVKFGNTFFYRIRAVAVNGTTSEWTYRGIKISDDSFERKISRSMTPALKSRLVSEITPLNIQSESSELRSFSLQPTFSDPGRQVNAAVSNRKPMSPGPTAVKSLGNDGSDT